MIINNVRLVLENEFVNGSVEVRDGVIRALPKPRAAHRTRWTAKAAGCYRG